MIGQTRAMPPLTLRPDEEKLYEGQPRGFPFGEFNLEDVMLPETDSDFGVASEEEEEEEEEVGTRKGAPFRLALWRKAGKMALENGNT